LIAVQAGIYRLAPDRFPAPQPQRCGALSFVPRELACFIYMDNHLFV
jgi:hypothetical protein